MPRTIEQLVNQQFLRWVEAERRFARDSEPPLPGIPKSTVSISGGRGALGGQVGRKVADYRDFRYHSK
jgi:hypothetical protein